MKSKNYSYMSKLGAKGKLEEEKKKALQSLYETTKSIGESMAYEKNYGLSWNDVRDNSSYKAELIKKFYDLHREEPQTIHADDCDSWYTCNECAAKVNGLYRMDHADAHYPQQTTFVRIYEPDSQANIEIKKAAAVSDAVLKLTKSIDGWTGEEVNAITILRDAGWEVQVNPAIAYGDRKGYQITIIEPKKVNNVVQPKDK